MKSNQLQTHNMLNVIDSGHNVTNTNTGKYHMDR